MLELFFVWPTLFVGLHLDRALFRSPQISTMFSCCFLVWAHVRENVRSNICILSCSPSGKLQCMSESSLILVPPPYSSHSLPLSLHSSELSKCWRLHCLFPSPLTCSSQESESRIDVTACVVRETEGQVCKLLQTYFPHFPPLVC